MGRNTIYEEKLNQRLEILVTPTQKRTMVARHRSGGPKPADQLRTAWEKANKFTETPLLGAIPAGDPQVCDTEQMRPVVCTEHPGGPFYAYLRVEGDSMNRRVPNGALALVHLNTPYRSGNVVAVCLAWGDRSEFTLKIYVEHPDGTVELQPDSYNKEHLPIILSDTPPRGRRKVHWLKPDVATVMGVYTGDYIFSGRK